MNPSFRKPAFYAVAVLMLTAVYSFLAWSAPARPPSPDESANSFFAREFVGRTSLSVPEPLNGVAGGLIHPRSVRAIGERLVPGGFIGWPVVLGTFGKIFGVAGIPYVVALLAAATVLAWGALVAWAFGPAVGTLAAALLAVQPVWWYWSSRPFMPNGGFLSLLIVGLWFAATGPLAGFDPKRRLNGHADLVIGGLAVSLAFAVRPAEAHWLALGGVVAVAVARQAMDWKRFSLFAAAVAAGTVPWLVLNFRLYGSLLATGYGQDVLGVPVDVAPQGGGERLLGPLRPFLFPLGFAPRTALQRFWEFAVLGQPVWSCLTAAALLAAILLALRSRKTAKHDSKPPDLHTFPLHPPPSTPPTARQAAFISTCTAISLWLIFYYGSYTAQDLPASGAATLGLSYYRYWLPLFVASTVPVAWGAARLFAMVTHDRRMAALAAMVGLVSAVSFLQVFMAPGEGLAALRSTLLRQDGEVRAVLAATEPEAIIICDQADKLLFPERRVITPLRSEATYAAIGRLAGRVPLYYYGITLPPKDVEYLREVRLKPFGLGVEPVRDFSLETLYRLPTVGGQPPL